jgi:AcrR family transcriptional regulator
MERNLLKNVENHASQIGTEMIFPKWKGIHHKSREARERILRAALEVLVDEGYGAMSMRRIAAKCGMKFGNLTYHYRKREDLVKELLESVFRGYEAFNSAITDAPNMGPDERLEIICRYTFQEIATKKTTRLFPELWALSNHDRFVFQRMHKLYQRGMQPILNIVAELRPDLSENIRAALALFITVSMEGLMVFAGDKKPFQPWCTALERIAASTFSEMIRNITAEEVGELPSLSKRSAGKRAAPSRGGTLIA